MEGTAEFWPYIAELRWAQHYALLNREEMMDRVIAQFSRLGGRSGARSASGSTATTTSPEQETHFGKSRVDLPQGRDQGRARRAGLIPGSMGTASYVVDGLATRCR